MCRPTTPVKVMRLRLRNLGRQPRRVSVTGYAEWVLGVTRVQSQHFVITERDANSGALLARNRYNTPFAEQVAFAYLGVSDDRRRGKRPAVTSTTDRTEFVGRNRTLADPAGLGAETLSGKVGAALDPCAALQTTLTVNPHESVEVVFLLGQGADAAEVSELVARYADPAQVEQALQAVHALWDDLLGAVQVRTPDPAMDLMLNRWLLYQATACRLWGRTAFYQSGGAYGFRDQLQDVLAVVEHAPRPGPCPSSARRGSPVRGRRRAALVASHHRPGRAHAFLRRFPVAALCRGHYVAETGDTAVLDEVVPFLKAPPLAPDEQEAFISAERSAESGTLYEHCLRAVDHGLRFGAHGLPLMGIGDWNDGMNRVGEKGKGESVWLGWFLLANLHSFAAVARERGDAAAAERWEQARGALAQALSDHGWDGAMVPAGVLRRRHAAGLSPERRVPDRFDCPIVGGHLRRRPARPGRAGAGLRRATSGRRDELRLSRLLAPPFNLSQPDPGYIQGYIPGIRENGGQYTHAALWLVLAHALRGHAERAAELFAMAQSHQPRTDGRSSRAL